MSRLSPEPATRRLAILGALILSALGGAAATTPETGRVAPFLIVFAATFALYAWACAFVLRGAPMTPDDGPAGAPDEGVALRVVVVFAVLFRAVFLFLPPALSTDLHRYLWDGRLVLAGQNPYRHAPDDPALAAFHGDPLYERIEHRGVRTIYPPAAQLLFAAGARFGAIGIKTLMVGADLLALWFLARLLRLRGRSPLRILLYAWNPLVVVEVAWSGHVEPAGIVCVLAGAAAIIQKRPLRGALALAAAGLVKVLPWALLVSVGRRLRPRAIAAALALGFAAYWPFFQGAGTALVSGLGTYARHWEGNGPVFPIIRALVTAIDPAGPLKEVIAFLRARVPGGAFLDLLYPWVHPPTLARAACAALLLAALIRLARRETDPLRAIHRTIGVAILLSPTVHPWYLLWIIPWLALFPGRAWILLTGLAPLAYINLGAPGGEPGGAPPHPWISLAVYVPCAALLLWDTWKARRPPAGGARLVQHRTG